MEKLSCFEGKVCDGVHVSPMHTKIRLTMGFVCLIFLFLLNLLIDILKEVL